MATEIGQFRSFPINQSISQSTHLGKKAKKLASRGQGWAGRLIFISQKFRSHFYNLKNQ